MKKIFLVLMLLMGVFCKINSQIIDKYKKNYCIFPNRIYIGSDILEQKSKTKFSIMYGITVYDYEEENTTPYIEFCLSWDNLTVETNNKIKDICRTGVCLISFITKDGARTKAIATISSMFKPGLYDHDITFDLAPDDEDQNIAYEHLFVSDLIGFELLTAKGENVLYESISAHTKNTIRKMMADLKEECSLNIDINTGKLLKLSKSKTNTDKGKGEDANSYKQEAQGNKLEKKTYDFSKVKTKCSKYNCYEIPFEDLQDHVFGILSQKLQPATIESVQAELSQVYNAKSKPWSPYNATALTLSCYQDDDFYNVKILGQKVTYSYFDVFYTGKKSTSYFMELYEKRYSYKQALSFMKSIQNHLEEMGYSFGQAHEQKKNYSIAGHNSMNKEAFLWCHGDKNDYDKFWSVSITFTE